MCHGRRERSRSERARPPFGRRWYDRENVVDRLESYQRDLEQELADVSDLLRRLREERPQPETVSV